MDFRMGDLNERMVRNTRIEGFFDQTRTICACPFCAAPNFMTLPISMVREAMMKGGTCQECRRSVRAVFASADPLSMDFEFVQSGGPDPPDWYEPKPRRVAP